MPAQTDAMTPAWNQRIEERTAGSRAARHRLRISSRHPQLSGERGADHRSARSASRPSPPQPAASASRGVAHRHFESPCTAPGQPTQDLDDARRCAQRRAGLGRALLGRRLRRRLVLGDDGRRGRAGPAPRVVRTAAVLTRSSTKADNPGLLAGEHRRPRSSTSPTSCLRSSKLPSARPISASGRGVRADTQHTQVGAQSGGEKTEAQASRKMTITKTPIAAATMGGHASIVSRQDINRTSPAILDMAINDLRRQYATQTEASAATVLTAAARLAR